MPLNDMATNVLARQVGKHPAHVFTYQGQPLAALANLLPRPTMAQSWHSKSQLVTYRALTAEQAFGT